MQQRNIEVLGEFTGIFESEPWLWKAKDKDYHNRDKRDAAWFFLNALKEIGPDLNETMVLKKSTV